jgi:glycosyltransferase involved in cell wall biosynthesis
MADSVLYAPNAHTGGGFVLLRGLLESWPAHGRRTAFLDERARARLDVPAGVDVRWVQARAASRLAAERDLQLVATVGASVLCFHGLPPLLRVAARVVVFQQNRNYLGLNPLRDFAPRTAARLAFERLVARRLRHRVAEYIVQTPTMARALTHWYGPGCPPVRVLPFVDAWPAPPAAAARAWDFVFVADGEAMKNHECLLQAWQLLAAQGLRPSLALTLGARDAALAARIEATASAHGLQVRNLGQLPRDEVLALYASARALVFPSISESFGLPLVEAAHLGLPIVAAELDYVRDVCTPEQTFDPHSPVSIARAVRRFLDAAEPPIAIGAPAALWAALGEGGAA